MGKTGLLLYCVSNTDMNDKGDILSLDGTNRIYSIKHGDIYGIVSDIDLEEFGEENINRQSEDVRWISSMAARFMDILIDVNSKSVIVPMKFLTLFHNEDRVHDILEENYMQFMSNLDHLNHKEEWSLKIYCDTKYFKKNCMGDEIEKFEKETSSKPKGVAFFLRKKFEDQLEGKAQDKMSSISNEIAEEAKKHALDMRPNKLLAKELSGKNERMILNCSLLIDRESKPEFIFTLEELEQLYAKAGFVIDYSGPWPPYNFC